VHGRRGSAHAIQIRMWPGDGAQGVGAWKFGGLSVGVSGNGCCGPSASILIAARTVGIASYALACMGASASHPSWPGLARHPN
jgi:hypothetical protein